MVITTVLATLASIAAMLGLSQGLDYVNAKIAKNNNVSQDDITKSIDYLINEAKTKSELIQQRLADRLASVQLPYGVTGKVKAYIQSTKRNLKNKVEQTVEDINKVNRELEVVQKRADNLGYQSDVYRYSDVGKRQLDDIKNSASQAVKRIEEIENNV